jgi:hypothetical protein
MSLPQPVELFVSLWLGWRVFGVLGSLEAEMAGDLFSEGVILGSQAADLGAGGIEPLAERVSGCVAAFQRVLLGSHQHDLTERSATVVRDCLKTRSHRGGPCTEA